MGNGFTLHQRVRTDRRSLLRRRHGQHADNDLADPRAHVFGAMMDYGGFNSRLITPVVQRVKSIGGTIALVMLTSLGFNIVAGDQYIAIVLPARMFMVEFRKRGFTRNPGYRSGKLGDGHFAIDPLELMRRLHDGNTGYLHVCVFPHTAFSTFSTSS